MDCRTFHKNLEDYLEGGLDFAGRFGMERHAQQCICCGKELSDALRLRRMVSELKRVRAPSNFESSLINEIGKRKLNARISGIRRLRFFAPHQLSWRQLALAASGLAVLGLGVFLSFRLAEPPQTATSPPVPEIIEKADVHNRDTGDASNENSKLLPSAEPAGTKTYKASAIPEQSDLPSLEFAGDGETPEAEYVEHMIMGEDGRPVKIQLPMPRKIRMQYGQMSEEYFIQNVSH
jgi:hypothetical protein